MDITIPKSLEALIRRKVDEGHYSTEDEVVADALRLMQARDEVAEIKRARLRVAATLHQVGDARRQVALRQQLEHPLHGQRHLLRGFQDERVAAHHRERQKSQRHHRGKVERRDGGAHANRLPHHHAVDAAGDVFEAVSHEERRRAARDLDALDAAAQAAARFVERLAVLGRDDAGDLLEVVSSSCLNLKSERARTTGGVSLHPGNACVAA